MGSYHLVFLMIQFYVNLESKYSAIHGDYGAIKETHDLEGDSDTKRGKEEDP